MYIYEKLSPGDLNPDTCPLHPTCIYTCEVIITPRIRGNMNYLYMINLSQMIQFFNTLCHIAHFCQ